MKQLLFKVFPISSIFLFIFLNASKSDSDVVRLSFATIIMKIAACNRRTDYRISLYKQTSIDKLLVKVQSYVTAQTFGYKSAFLTK